MYYVYRVMSKSGYKKLLLKTNEKKKAHALLDLKYNMWSWNDCTRVLKKFGELPYYQLEQDFI